MKKNKWLILLMIIIVFIISIYFTFFHKNMSKVLKNGNNMSTTITRACFWGRRKKTG